MEVYVILRPDNVMNILHVRRTVPSVLALGYARHVKQDFTVHSVRHVLIDVKTILMLDVNLTQGHVMPVKTAILDFIVISSVKIAMILVVTRMEPATNV